ncbi:hypothetical protein [Phycicoccus flavus]|uniref:hypothetical protein n=1 Tax=Phycicoccus flavus TaxID=2502783 RepID=UPI000FEB8236|nr:hypothetical protein [Phycicoccus flavus]NHA66592.1 hypothetical protein [Phycicoccus flavus]
MRVVAVVVTAVFVAAVAVGAVVLGTRGGAAATRLETTYAAGTPRCEITDPRLPEISGTAELDGELWMVNDKGATLYRVDSACRVTRSVDLLPQLTDRKVRVRDVEDLVASPDGWLWMADTGGNRAPRFAVQLIGWNPTTQQTKVVVLDYPSGRHDTEALLVGVDGRAVLVTKEEFGPGTVFVTPGPLVDGNRTALVRQGTVDLGDPGGASRDRLVTGAAVSSTGVFAVLRTYRDAYEYDVVDGDIAAALVGGTPRTVPLPPSRQGEAITYADAGTAFIATTEGLPASVDTVRITRTRVEVP